MRASLATLLSKIVRWLRVPANGASALVLVVLCSFAIQHSLSFTAFFVDDAFITFRYADNLAHGRGFVFNPGEHVEGTSTFLTTVLLALVRVPGADLLGAARVLGVGSFVALIVGTFVVVRDAVPQHGRVLGLGAAAAVTSSTSLTMYAMSGLETTFFAALVLLTLSLHLRAARTPALGPKAWSLAAGAVALTRPEGVGYFIFLWCCAVLHDACARWPPRAVVRRAATSLGWFSLLYAPLLVFRVAYFHALVPNTVTAKANFLATLKGKPLSQIASILADGTGAHHFAEYVTMLGVAAYLVPLGLLRKTTRYATSIFCLTITASLVIDALDEGDWMPGWRLLTPAVAPICVAIALGLSAILYRPDQRLFGTHALSLLAVVLVFEPAAVRMYPGGYTPSPMEAYRVWLAKALAPSVRADDVMATDMAGLIPYYSDIRAIDMNGLCDRTIALEGQPLGTMGKTDRPYVIGRRPTFFQPNFVGEMKALYNDPAFAPMRSDYYAVITEGYRKAAKVRDRKILAVRKDRLGVKELAASLGGELVDLGQQLALEH